MRSRLLTHGYLCKKTQVASSHLRHYNVQILQADDTVVSQSLNITESDPQENNRAYPMVA